MATLSMAARFSDLDDQKPGINIQTEGHTLTPPGGHNGPKDPEAFGSAPSHSSSQSLARTPTPDWPETQYCLEIQVTSTKNKRVTPQPSHTWQVPFVEDMVQDGKTEAIATSPCLAILFYGWQVIRRGTEPGQGARCLIYVTHMKFRVDPEYFIGWGYIGHSDLHITY